MYAKILVVDDDRFVLEYLCLVLNREGYSITCTSTGEKALQILREQDFHLVIADMMMPDITGMKLLETINEKKPDTTCILITAYGSLATAIKALRLGASDYLVKPFDEEELLIRVKNTLDRQSLRKERDVRARELEALVLAISHDIAGHLVALRGFANRLRAKFAADLPTEAISYLDRMDSSSALMERLVAGIASYARLGRDTDAKFEPVELNEILQEVMQNLHDLIDEKKAVVHIADNLPEIRTEWVRAYQVFHNLVMNALKFSRDDVRPEITIGVEENGTHYRFYIRDNGIGIRKEDREKIFEMFGRGTHPQAAPGTGLGLAIARRVIEQAGGDIWVESEEGKGSTFFFTLPKVRSPRKMPPHVPVHE